MRPTRLLAWLGPLLAMKMVACEEVADPRPQLLVVVDTDLPTVEQATLSSDLSFAASIDSLRVDIYKLDLTPIESRVIVAPSPEDWPISFGIQADGETDRVLIQTRVFRAALATPDADSVIPERALTVERVIDVALPTEGIEVVGVTLRGECLGIAPSFNPPSSCATAAEPAQSATEAAETGADLLQRPTIVGTAPLSRSVPCENEPPEGALCVQGGFAHLGDPSMVGVSDGFVIIHDPLPIRPYRLSPFHMDATELTVGRARELLAPDPALVSAEELVLRDPSSDLYDDCTWLGVDNAENDALPLSCTTFEGARKLCRAAGGDLPTEAQWEFAARGRGQQRPYAWGDEFPECCLGRFEGCVTEPASVGSSGCGGLSDTTRDGFMDMTGNLTELTLDSYVGYDAPCWSGAGVLDNPHCVDDSVETITMRGAAYDVTGLIRQLAVRRQGLRTAAIEYIGFRCVYPDSH